ncbi:MAG: AI-2E family transporter [Nevskiales bacterium]|nr:AI-2E family transporter [Nevskiales bacterium]
MSDPDRIVRTVTAPSATAAPPSAQSNLLPVNIAAWLLAGIALTYVLYAELLPALLAGLLVHQLVQLLVPFLVQNRLSSDRAKIVAVALLAALVVILITLASAGLVASFRSGAESIPALLTQTAEIIEAKRDIWPAWLIESLPADADALEQAVAGWLREHAGMLRGLGIEAGRATAYILIGMIVGAFVALGQARSRKIQAPLNRALSERVARLGHSFRSVVFAQVRISAVNTVLTWLYLGVALPLFGAGLPLTKTLVAVTFICGLLPVVGNLISNTFIVVVSLSHSLELAMISLAFLIVIHKLEYFLNARIVGGQINARTWELLIAMLALEAAFGIAGLIAAPIYYAYLKNELSARGLI